MQAMWSCRLFFCFFLCLFVSAMSGAIAATPLRAFYVDTVTLLGFFPCRMCDTFPGI